MAEEKREPAARLLREKLRCVCVECRKSKPLLGKDRRQVVNVTGPSCEVCGGRSVTRALLLVEKTLPGSGIHRILVVGGSPPIYDELRRGLTSPEIELQLIDSVQNANRATALAEWADVIVIWGSSILAHKTSASFQKPEYKWKTVTLTRRGIEALSQELLKHAAQR